MIHSDAMTANECLDFYRAGERVRHREHGLGRIIKRMSARTFDVWFERVGPKYCALGEIALAGHSRAVE
jgi:hypothetical protein